MGIRTTVMIEKDQYNMIEEIGGMRNKSRFIRHCINYFIVNGGDKELQKFRVMAKEIEKMDHIRLLIQKETTLRNAFKCIRRSGFFVDKIKEQIHDEYPEGVLSEEKKAIDYLLNSREDIVKELVKFVPNKKSK